MIRNNPHGGGQKLRTRSTLRVSLPLMMRITVHHGTKCARTERAKRAGVTLFHCVKRYCVRICCDVIRVRLTESDKGQAMTNQLQQYVTIWLHRLTRHLTRAILSM